MSEESVPFGGENIPFRQMDEENPVKPAANPTTLSQPEKKTNAVIFVLGGLVVVLIATVIYLVLVKLKNPTIAPSPIPSPVVISASPQSTPSAVSVEDKINSLESSLREVNMSQTELSFPHVDFKLDIVKTPQ